jgi:hypothetical protein
LASGLYTPGFYSTEEGEAMTGRKWLEVRTPGSSKWSLSRLMGNRQMFPDPQGGVMNQYSIINIDTQHC